MTAIPVRKNVLALEGNQRRQFFWCLKGLGVIPSFASYKDRPFWTLGYPTYPKRYENGDEIYYQIYPKNLHDELISNHATCCQHVSFFFGYYHRHLMFHLEMRLNYVDECFRLSQQEFSKKFPEVWAKAQAQVKTVLSVYKSFAPPGKVMGHYWNPTNYNNADDLLIPPQIRDPSLQPANQYTQEPIDKLYNAMWQHYYYEINAETRWFQTKDLFTPQHRDAITNCFINDEGKRYFNPEEYILTPNETAMTKGTYNPRTQKDNITAFYKDYAQWADMKSTGYFPNSKKLTSWRNYKKWNETHNRVNLAFQNEGELLTNYGGRFDQKHTPYNMHYLNSSEMTGGTGDLDRVNYNNFLPHYQTGYSLYNSEYPYLIDFLDPKSGKTFERPHNTMHNNLHFTMMDDNFSLTNLIFFLYHSWIDLHLEMKIRLGYEDPKNHFLMVQKMNSVSRRTQYFDPLLNPEQNLKVWGQYPIIEYCDPKFTMAGANNPSLTFDQRVQRCQELGLSAESIKTAFNSHHLYLNGSKIRMSTELRQFYNQFYIQGNNQFPEYTNFPTYNANYDYQIFETKADHTNIKKPLGLGQTLYIPEYLRAMQQQVNGYSEYLTTFIKNYSYYNNQLARTHKYYRELVLKNLLIIIRYRPWTPNGNYMIQGSLPHLFKFLKDRGYHVTDNELKAFKDNDIGVSFLSVFGKASSSSQCPNCGDWKQVVVNLSEELFSRYPRLWAWVQLALLKEVKADTSRPDFVQFPVKDQVDLKDFMSIESNSLSKYFDFKYVQGAERIEVEMIVVGTQEQLKNVYMEVSADISRLEDDTSTTQAYKTMTQEDLLYSQSYTTAYQLMDKTGQELNAYTCKFEFYDMRDTTLKLKRDELDGQVYTKVNFNLFVGGYSQKFWVLIKNYHEIMSYRVEVRVGDVARKNEPTRKGLQVKVIDADYRFKKNLYDSKAK